MMGDTAFSIPRCVHDAPRFNCLSRSRHKRRNSTERRGETGSTSSARSEVLKQSRVAPFEMAASTAETGKRLGTVTQQGSDSHRASGSPPAAPAVSGDTPQRPAVMRRRQRSWRQGLDTHRTSGSLPAAPVVSGDTLQLSVATRRWQRS